MAQTLETIIAINATVGSGFAEIGNTLTVLGAQIDGISDKLINFGKDSLGVYQDYEKSMAEARVALATNYGKDTKELITVMEQLDTQAREWASTTIFHTNDVGNAITEAARAGWDYNQIMTGIPAAMQLAQAGSIDLSEAVYYITEAAKAGGIAFEDLGGFVDMWAYTANSSNGTIASFGDTMLKLGSVMQFAGSREELLSLIAVMHDTGTEGSTAATLLRTAMMNILAPSGTAGTVLEQLGATEEEIKSIREDASKVNALNILESYGFSAFDAQGQAKPILQIFNELGAALAEIAGGYDKIDSNETTLGILGTVFGKRGITGALNIINMMEHAQDLEQQLINGAATGYGEYSAGTMMDTLYGNVETWKSKVENLKLKTGETLSDQLQPVLETLGGIVDNLASLDTGVFNAIVSGLEVIAAAGPGLMLAGGAFRFLAYALTPAGGIGLTAIALATAAAAINELEKADFAGKFGDLGLDPAQVESYVKGIGEEFKAAYADVDEFTRAINDAVTAYTDASSTLKSNLLTDMLTGVEIKEGSNEYNSLVKLGENMCVAVQDGIKNNYAATAQSIYQSFGGGEGEEVDNAIWDQISQVLEQGMQLEITRAEGLSRQLREAMTSAFSDGHLTAEEIANIQSIMDEQNALLAQQQDREHYLEQQRILRKAQTLGLEAIRQSSEQVEAERDAEWNALMDRQAGDYYDLDKWYDTAIERGWMVDEIVEKDGKYEKTGKKVRASEKDKDIAMAELSAHQETERYEWAARFSDFLTGIWETGIRSSDLSDTWDALNLLGQSVRESGGYITAAAENAYMDSTTVRGRAQAREYLEDFVSSLGGIEELGNMAEYFESIGESSKAEQYRNLQAMYEATGGKAGNRNVEAGTQLYYTDYFEGQSTYDMIANLLKGSYGDAMTPEKLLEMMNLQPGGINTTDYEWKELIGDDLQSQLYRMAEESGLGVDGTRISAMIANAVTGKSQSQLSQVEPPSTPVPAGTQATLDHLQGYGVTANVNGDTTELQGTLSALDAQNITTYIDADASDLNAEINAADGQHITTIVNGNTSQLRAELAALQNQVINVTIRTHTSNIAGTAPAAYAEGGRADEASIFGEAGPEWAIPEEHSERTAALLNAAANASGFTWPELLARNGGLNANPNNAPVTLVYSPTINARDVTGVEEALRDDKKRLDKWYEEKQMRDEAEVYA